MSMWSQTVYWTLVNITNKPFELKIWGKIVEVIEPWEKVRVLRWQAEHWAEIIVKRIMMTLWNKKYYDLLAKLWKQQTEVNYIITLPEETKKRIYKMALWELPLTPENFKITDEMLSWDVHWEEELWFVAISNVKTETETKTSIPDFTIEESDTSSDISVDDTSIPNIDLSTLDYHKLRAMCLERGLTTAREDTGKNKNKQELIDTLNSLKQ